MVPDLVSTVSFKQWIEDNRHLLKPPVGNKCVWDNGAYIVMVVGGPNARKDYHFNSTPEFFYQLEGDMVLRIQHNGKPLDVEIKEGDIYCLPGNVPHSPQRKANTIGLVIEQKRPDDTKDALEWYCEKCNNPLCREEFLLQNIETDMPAIFDRFYSNLEQRTCSQCGHIMEPPVKPV